MKLKPQSTPEAQEFFATQQLLSPFRERPIAVESTEAAEARLHRIVPHLESYTQGLLQAQRRRRVSTRGAWLLAALALGVSAGLFYGRFDDSTAVDGITIAGELVQVGAADERTVLRGNLEVSALGRVETHELGARISTHEGLDLDLGPESKALVGRLGGSAERQRVRLDAGHLSCSVPKLGEAREFSVVTPDARVVVHGTRFTVEVRDTEDGKPHTCVRVSEGKVSVHGVGADANTAAVFLTAGSQYGCDIPEAKADMEDAVAGSPYEPSYVAEPAYEDLAEVDSRDSARKSPAPLSPVRAPGATGTLEVETRLLQTALRAERRGDRRESRARANELLARYPRSPLRKDAELLLDRLAQ
jgi:ferric-dicitrate binding protein FerR (iron transport regulator)